MITMKELNRDNFPIDQDIKANLELLLKKINVVREMYGKPMVVTNGLRSMDKHIEIYKKKLGRSYTINKVPMKSQHLIGAAVDIADPDGKLAAWCIDNLPKFKDIALYMEDFNDTAGYVHFQLFAPKSGNRVFKP